MYALIDTTGIVLEVAPVSSPVVGDAEWIEVSGGQISEVGDIYDVAAETFSPDLSTVKSAKVAALRAACAAAITGGFVSSALGAPHIYPSGATDQINLMGSVTDTLLPDLPEDWSTPFWCRDAAGEWDFRLHDATQIRQAGRDGKRHVVECQAMLADLSFFVNEATTIIAVNAIQWPEQE